jgi:putative membrane protein
MDEKDEMTNGQEEEGEQSKQELAEERSKYAEMRTEWAEHRTLLANERTFSAWLRTGLSSIGGGLAVAEFLSDVELPILPEIIGILLVVIGGGVCLLAFWRYNQISEVLEREEHLRITPKWVTLALVILLMIIVLLVLALIIIQ